MQENKNLILAILLSLIVLLGWGYLSEYMGWVQPRKQIAQEAPKETASVPADEPAASLPTFTPSPGRDITVDTPLYKAAIYSGGGTLRSFVLKKFQSGIKPDSPLVNLIDSDAAAVAPLGLVINSQPSWSIGQWSLDSGSTDIAVAENGKGILKLSGLVDSLRISRTLEFDASTYLIREKIVVTNASDHPRSVRMAYTQAMDENIAAGGQYDSMRLAWDENGTLEEESASDLANGIKAAGQIYWAGPMSTYFLAAALPAQTTGITMKGVMRGTVFRVALEQEELSLNPGQSHEFAASYWLGPKNRAEMLAVSEELVKSINLGFFSGIGKCLLWLLEFFYGYVHNWGLAIILLTVLIKAVFWPLTAKSYSSMEKMKELQPFMNAIREKYKDNREAMNKEVMALYKSHKINPASGCVPILIQLPVFFGLYQALLTSIALRHASFITYLPGTDIIWLADLSAKDPLYITPLLMGLSMFAQQKMSPPPADPMQKKIMMFLPLIFTVLFLTFPSGLVLYWLVNNILSIFQQWLMIRKMKNIKAARESAKPKKA